MAEAAVKKKLAIVTTHPIQYYAPWFKLLSEQGQVDVKIFYTWSQAKNAVKDRTFGKTIAWDIPLLDGYNYEFVENVSTNPGTHHKHGIDCPELISKIESWSPDAILVFGWYLKSHFKVMRHFKGKTPVWFRGDSTLLDDTPGIKQLLRRLYLRYVYTYIDKAFYVGTENKKYFKALGVKEHQLIFAPHAIDNARFFDSESKQYEAQAATWRLELGYNTDDLVVLFAGKFEPKKQPDVLIKAVQRANQHRKIPLKLLMVGNGPLEKELLDLSKNDAHIKFMPFQNQSKMPILYRLGNMFCLPSKGPGETWGLAVNEAMASGRPVMVSDKVGCASDLVQHNSNGFVFKSTDQGALHDMLLGLNHADLNKKAKQARNDIGTWNFNAIVEAVQNEIRK